MRPSSSPSKRVLFLTNVEAGETATQLSVCHALMQEDPAVEIHLGSWAGIKGRLAATNEFAGRTSTAKPVVLHEFDGINHKDASLMINPDDKDAGVPGMTEPPTVSNVLLMLSGLATAMCPWDGPEFIKVYESVVRIIDDVKPDLIVVNSLFSPGLTAALNSGRKRIVLSPNSVKDFSGRGWKFPVMGSALPYPIPLRLLPLQFLYLAALLLSFLTNKRLRELKTYVRSHAGVSLTTTFDLVTSPPKDLKILVASCLEVEYEGVDVPNHVRVCGLMPQASPSVSEVDPEMSDWLAKGPTVLVSLGSHTKASEEDAREMAQALREMLDAADSQAATSASGTDASPRPQIQVLWKLIKKDQYAVLEAGSKIQSILGKELKSGRVKIVPWIKAEPMSVLKSGHVVCSVSHGGANSFSEAACAGVPQVILPQWADCYDYAYRVQLLGVGRWGSPTTKPKWLAKELAPELIDVVVTRADQYRRRAKELSVGLGGGDAKAARFLLEELEAA